MIPLNCQRFAGRYRVWHWLVSGQVVVVLEIDFFETEEVGDFFDLAKLLVAVEERVMDAFTLPDDFFQSLERGV